MTYFGFLLRFLVPPILILALLAWRDHNQGRRLPQSLTGFPPWIVLGAHVIVAVAYTTPWDNYLVANRIWWYDPALVTGLTLGWVPIEEYTFFVLQTLLTGLWLLFLARRLREGPAQDRPGLRIVSTAALGLVWAAATAAFILGWRRGAYLALELAWALPPIMLQLAVGADLLWQYRRLVLAALTPVVVYLSATDALAIGFGTWTINPEMTVNLKLGHLPLEEFVFFLLTNTLIVFGMILSLAHESQARMRRWAIAIRRRAAR